jgi:hypothetical protein
MSLTPDRGRRAVRALAAATAKLAAGEPDRARGLMKIARQGPLGPPDRARLDLLEARAVLLLTQSLDGAPELFLHAARQLAPFDAAVSRETYLQAIQEAIHAGRLGSIDGLRNTARAARAAPEATQPPRPVDLLLDGMVTRFTTGGAAATRALDKALAAFREQADGQVPHVAMLTAIALWDDETWGMIVEGGVQLARRTGNLAGLLLISRDLIGLNPARALRHRRPGEPRGSRHPGGHRRRAGPHWGSHSGRRARPGGGDAGPDPQRRPGHYRLRQRPRARGHRLRH